MNKIDRKEVAAIRVRTEQIRGELIEYANDLARIAEDEDLKFNNLPEQFQTDEKQTEYEGNVDLLNDAEEDLREAATTLVGLSITLEDF